MLDLIIAYPALLVSTGMLLAGLAFILIKF
jgi:hypothetical protein